MRKGEIKKQS